MKSHSDELSDKLVKQLSTVTQHFILKELGDSEAFAFVMSLIVTAHMQNMFNFMRYITQSLNDPAAQEFTEKIIKRFETLFQEVDLKE